MTNVPQDLRDMWADIYRLFDSHYNMPNTAEAWTEFWDKANGLAEKHKSPYVMVLTIIVSEMIEHHMTGKMLNPCTLEDMKLF